MMSSNKKSKKIRISDEEPAHVSIQLNLLRGLVLNDNALDAPVDDVFLLKFLRSSENDGEIAYDLIQKYYQLRIDFPELYRKVRPSELLTSYENGVLTLLPRRDQHGRHILLYRAGAWDPNKCSPYENLYSFQTAVEIAAQEEETQKNGMIIIADWKGYSWRHFRLVRPSIARLGVKLMQESLPIRYYAFHIINQHRIFQLGYLLIHHFFNEDHRKKVFFHGSNMSSLHKHVDPDALPLEYGGNAPSITELNSAFVRHVLTFDDEFYTNSHFGYKSDPLEMD